MANACTMTVLVVDEVVAEAPVIGGGVEDDDDVRLFVGEVDGYCRSFHRNMDLKEGDRIQEKMLEDP